MEITTTTDLLISQPTVVSSIATTESGRRYIAPQAGRALEILGHAIEYLSDELVHECVTTEMQLEKNAHMDAIQLLMALNRKVYYECPIRLTARERIAALFGLSN